MCVRVCVVGPPCSAFAEKLIEETHEEWLKLIEERGARAVVTKE